MLKSCKICGREYECYDKRKAGRGSRLVSKKPCNSVTCSRKCSRKNIDNCRKTRILRIRGISAQKRGILIKRWNKQRGVQSAKGCSQVWEDQTQQECAQNVNYSFGGTKGKEVLK